MMKVINCIIVDDEAIAREVLEELLRKIENIRIVASCRNALEAFQAVNAHQVDLVFLDINMPDISGLSFAKSMSKGLKIIFTTAYRDYAVDGFDLKAVDYLLKPISFERLLQGVNKYLEEITPQNTLDSEETEPDQTDSIFVRAERKMVKVKFSEIIYVESLGDYIKIHLDDLRVLVTRETLSNIQARLPAGTFIRTHRSYLVSIAKIDSFTSDTIEIGKHEIPISRSYQKEVMKKLGGITS